MYINVRSNLAYQKGAMELLHIYLQSEYQHLQGGSFSSVELLEGRIIRVVQNAFENQAELRRMLGERTIEEFAGEQEEYLGAPLLDLLGEIERFQGLCREQAARNKVLARILDEEHTARIEALYGFTSMDADPGSVRYH